MTVAPQNRFSQPGSTAPPDREFPDGGAREERGPSAVKLLSQQFAELKEFASHYLSAKQDAAKLSVKQSVVYAGLGVVGLIFLSNLVLAATAALVVGISWGIASLLPDYAWVGPLATGAVLLLIIGITAWIVLRQITGKSRSRTLKKYERRIQQQTAQFGHNVHDEARHAPSE